jgi:hypothetical protein
MAKQPCAPVPVTADAFVPLTAQHFARRVEIQEDGAAPQGLIVEWPDGAIEQYPADQQPIVLSEPSGNAVGALIGVPSYSAGVIATQYCQVKSMGNATTVRVTEIN